jgi:hypothetical protein
MLQLKICRESLLETSFHFLSGNSTRKINFIALKCRQSINGGGLKVNDRNKLAGFLSFSSARTQFKQVFSVDELCT